MTETVQKTLRQTHFELKALWMQLMSSKADLKLCREVDRLCSEQLIQIEQADRMSLELAAAECGLNSYKETHDRIKKLLPEYLQTRTVEGAVGHLLRYRPTVLYRGPVYPVAVGPGVITKIVTSEPLVLIDSDRLVATVWPGTWLTQLDYNAELTGNLQYKQSMVQTDALGFELRQLTF